MDSLTGVASGDVRFTPESGHSHGSRKRSAYDPKRTFVKHGIWYDHHGYDGYSRKYLIRGLNT